MYFRRKILLNLFKLSDLCILIIGILFASWMITDTMGNITLEEFLSLRIKLINLIYLICIISLWYIIFQKLGLYRSRRLYHNTQEWKDIFKATTIGNVIFFIGGMLFGTGAFTFLFFTLVWLSTTIITIFFRSSLRYFLKKIRVYGRNLRFIAIVGTNHRAYELGNQIEKNKEFGYRVQGYIDDIVYDSEAEINMLGRPEDFPNIIRNIVIDEIIIALPIKSQYEKTQKIIEQAEEQGIIVRCLSQPFNDSFSSTKVSSIEGYPVMTIVDGPQENWRFLIKRILDIALASILLILTFPTLLIAAIAIKLTTPGPIFFVQDRVGLNKRVFPMYKLRTMVANAEKLHQELESLNEMDGPVFKIADDPRITMVGKWLRKTSIDELPQLCNVLKGDMSLVGPRPLPVRDYEGFKQDRQRRRFSVRPGITCLWQINGRNAIPFEQWMELDMQYIDQWSLWLDFKIIVKTIPAVFKGIGAG